ncbi:hypothetical protein L580_3324 [Serratia fonticola AU-P3(3)]|nr:hypothetical protein L580_3324 [Serratia fonticola AU-P3(3)]
MWTPENNQSLSPQNVKTTALEALERYGLKTVLDGTWQSAVVEYRMPLGASGRHKSTRGVLIMSVTESKAKVAKKSSKSKTSVKASVKELKAVLENTVIQQIPLLVLVKSPFNVRIIPYSIKSVEELANSIIAVGLLQNLVVHELPDGKYGVAAGGCRLAALNLLVEKGVYTKDQLISVKVIPTELATVASMTENGKRKDMHPVEQIVGFRTMSAEGKTAAQIGDLLGYSSRHVQRMLKLAGLAPEILEELASDLLTTEHCHALALEDDPVRQLQVLSIARQTGSCSPYSIRCRITESEVEISDSGKFKLVADTFSDEEIRRDLFSESDQGYVDAVLLDNRVLNKLEQAAIEIKKSEGWSWCHFQLGNINTWGEDALTYHLSDQPEFTFTEDEQSHYDQLTASIDEFDCWCPETDVLNAKIDEIKQQAINRTWTTEQKALSGVVVSYKNGNIFVQRGVRLVEATEESDDDTVVISSISTEREPEPVDAISVPLLTKMSSERTLAVQAALIQDTNKAVALLAWKLCCDLFSHNHNIENKALKVSLYCEHNILLSNTPSGKDGLAYQAIIAEKERIKAILPENWKRDFTTFFSLDNEQLLAILGLCTASGINGVQTRESGRTSLSPLDKIELALSFNLREWWQPTKSNFFGYMKKNQIIDALNETGATGAARDAEKMKKDDVANLAELDIKKDWIPVWLKAPVLSCDDENDVNIA